MSTPDVATGEDTTPAEGSAPAAATQPGEAAADSEQDDRTVLGAVPWLVAGLAGILVPVVLDKLKIDPALASGAFVTTVTDVVGFFAFLGLAGMVLL